MIPLPCLHIDQFNPYLQDPAVELQLVKYGFDSNTGLPFPLPPPASKPVKKIGKDREALEVEPGQIARTPTKTHMGLITDFNFTARMKKTSAFCS